MELLSSLNASRALKDLDTDYLFKKSGFSAPVDVGPKLQLVRILYAWSDQDQHFGCNPFILRLVHETESFHNFGRSLQIIANHSTAEPHEGYRILVKFGEGGKLGLTCSEFSQHPLLIRPMSMACSDLQIDSQILSVKFMVRVCVVFNSRTTLT